MEVYSVVRLNGRWCGQECQEVCGEVRLNGRWCGQE